MARSIAGAAAMIDLEPSRASPTAMPAPGSARHPSRHGLLRTVRLLLHPANGHAFPSSPGTVAPPAGFPVPAIEYPSLPRAHPAGESATLSPAFPAQTRRRSFAHAPRKAKDCDRQSETSKNESHVFRFPSLPVHPSQSRARIIPRFMATAPQLFSRKDFR